MSLRLAKLAASLQYKKYRNREQLFIAEGEKLVLDLLSSFTAKHVLCTEEWAAQHPDISTIIISENLLKKATSLKNPTSVLGIFHIPKEKKFNEEELPALILDGIQDPGNLGTIIRTAAWFGIRHIICSLETADAYNPKVVQATMGALAMVQIHYRPLASFIEQLRNNGIATMGTFLEGDNIYQTQIHKKSAIIIGNEGKGISHELKPLITHSIHIPRFAKKGPESLNASISAAIICSEMARQTTQN